MVSEIVPFQMNMAFMINLMLVPGRGAQMGNILLHFKVSRCGFLGDFFFLRIPVEPCSTWKFNYLIKFKYVISGFYLNLG